MEADVYGAGYEPDDDVAVWCDRMDDGSENVIIQAFLSALACSEGDGATKVPAAVQKLDEADCSEGDGATKVPAAVQKVDEADCSAGGGPLRYFFIGSSDDEADDDDMTDGDNGYEQTSVVMVLCARVFRCPPAVSSQPVAMRRSRAPARRPRTISTKGFLGDKVDHKDNPVDEYAVQLWKEHDRAKSKPEPPAKLAKEPAAGPLMEVSKKVPDDKVGRGPPEIKGRLKVDSLDKSAAQQSREFDGKTLKPTTEEGLFQYALEQARASQAPRVPPTSQDCVAYAPPPGRPPEAARSATPGSLSSKDVSAVAHATAELTAGIDAGAKRSTDRPPRPPLGKTPKPAAKASRDAQDEGAKKLVEFVEVEAPTKMMPGELFSHLGETPPHINPVDELAGQQSQEFHGTRLREGGFLVKEEDIYEFDAAGLSSEAEEARWPGRRRSRAAPVMTKKRKGSGRAARVLNTVTHASDRALRRPTGVRSTRMASTLSDAYAYVSIGCPEEQQEPLLRMLSGRQWEVADGLRSMCVGGVSHAHVGVGLHAVL